MLEFCLPVSGLASLSIIGVLAAFRERKIYPEIITAVSGGAWAGMSYVAECAPGPPAIHFCKAVRDHVFSKPITRFLPPYKNGMPEELLEYCVANSSDPDHIKKLGVKHFYIGYTKLPFLKFCSEDVLQYKNRYEIFDTIWKSCTLPFITHHGFHYNWALDGGFRKIAFPSDHEVRERWLFTCYHRPLKWFLKNEKFDRIIHIKTPIKMFIFATDRQMEEAFESGYEQGMKIEA